MRNREPGGVISGPVLPTKYRSRTKQPTL